MAETSQVDINIPFPDAGLPQLRLELAACRLTLRPGEGPAWVTGTYDDMAGSLPLRIQQDGPTLRITQRETLAGTADLEEGFTRKSGAYWNQAALAGQAPVLTLKVTVLLGQIRLRSL